jgi:hypothetical protein
LVTYSVPSGQQTLAWRYSKNSSVNAGSDRGWVDQVLWAPSLSPYSQWKSINFTPLEAVNPLISGPDADPDMDGVKNLLEFAFGLNPKSGASVQVPVAQVMGGNLVISFTQPPGVSGIIYSAEWSPTLAPPVWQNVPDTGVGANHIFSVPIGANPTGFMRVKVTLLNP